MIRLCVNPVNLCEPLAAMVHTTKPHDVRPISLLCEPCVPFLDMVMVAVNKRSEHGSGHPLPSCANKIHMVHAACRSARRVVVLPRESLASMVHTTFTWFTEVTE